MPDKRAQIGRVAFREEGDMWNAYFAAPDTMEGATLLGSIRMTLAQDPALKQAFMTMMRSAMDVAIKSTLGTKPEWPGPERAPEHERSGRA